MSCTSLTYPCADIPEPNVVLFRKYIEGCTAIWGAPAKISFAKYLGHDPDLLYGIQVYTALEIDSVAQKQEDQTVMESILGCEIGWFANHEIIVMEAVVLCFKLLVIAHCTEFYY